MNRAIPIAVLAAILTTTITAPASLAQNAPAAPSVTQGEAAASLLYPNRAPLGDSTLIALPLGSVKANGWLLKQLQMQRDGLTGNAETVIPEIGPDSGWLGGPGEKWEKGPYYLKGLLPLAYGLDDAVLKERAQKWVDAILSSQRDDGFYGPKDNDDYWPRMVVNYALRDYAEATGDVRVAPFLTRYYGYLRAELPKRKLRDWGRSRAGDEIDTLLWLYNRTGDAALLQVADLLHAQAYDWTAIFTDNTFQNFGNDFQPKHNVNIPQARKMPGVYWQKSKADSDLAAPILGSHNLLRDHGLSIGLQSGTEFLAGRSTTQGIEFCSIVEKMLSDETLARITADPRYGDDIEAMAYNALPAAWRQDLKAMQYYTLPNEVIAVRGRLGVNQDHDDGILPGPHSGFHCCTYNVHMGWPKLVQNAWAATADGGIAAIVYGPTTVTFPAGDARTAVTIQQQTAYPFSPVVKLVINPSASVAFPLKLRLPAWCAAPTVTVNGAPHELPPPRQAHRRLLHHRPHVESGRCGRAQHAHEHQGE